jgi:hypothetical protein
LVIRVLTFQPPATDHASDSEAVGIGAVEIIEENPAPVGIRADNDSCRGSLSPLSRGDLCRAHRKSLRDDEDRKREDDTFSNIKGQHLGLSRSTRWLHSCAFRSRCEPALDTEHNQNESKNPQREEELAD